MFVSVSGSLIVKWGHPKNPHITQQMPFCGHSCSHLVDAFGLSFGGTSWFLVLRNLRVTEVKTLLGFYMPICQIWRGFDQFNGSYF